MLLGRQDECAVLDRLLDGARAGRGVALVLEGEAGVGKTALLEYAIASASDLRVLHTIGIESEIELAFAAIHQLCAPVLDRVERLPVPQRDALLTTIGLRAGPVPDRFLVGLAVLSLLSEVADERALLCVVDDAQWLDQASAQCLAFVARRLLAESVAMVFATRERSDLFTGMPELVVEGLRAADARSLLVSVIPGWLGEGVVDALLAETRGNPLALLELPRGLTAAQLAGGFGLPGALSLSGRIEDSFVTRLQALPPETQSLLLVAAADPLGDPALWGRAAERLGIAGAALEPAESAGLIEVDGDARFRHPLVRSAIYRSATVLRRRSVHRALAEATDAEVAPDRRAWHLAEAASGLDEEAATELERSAGRAQARGGFAAAAAFLQRAAALTPEPTRRAERALAAAQMKFQAGALEDALGLLISAEAGVLSDLERAQLGLLRAQIAFASRHGNDAATLLLEAARQLAELDPAVAGEAYLEALVAAGFAGRLARPGGTALEVAEAVRVAAGPHGAREIDLLIEALVTLFSDGYEAAVPTLRNAQGAFETDMPAATERRWGWLAGVVSVHLWDDERWDALSERHVRLARETGALGDLQLALSQRISMDLFAGELAAAASLVEELRSATEATGSHLAPYGAASLLALEGREAAATLLINNTRAEVTGRGEGIGVSVLDWSVAVLYNGLGRYDEACSAALRIAEHPQDLAPSNWHLAELIEAAARAGTPERARDAHERLARMAQASGTQWALGIAARSRALLAGDEEAEELYVEAIERLRRTRIRVELARAHLLYGEWLRRESRRTDAREQLRTAHGMLTSMGVGAFAGRAERELRATGEHVPKHTIETRDELTPQEAEVAGLARDGLSNPEIGARLFISRHTVHYHLSKVFRKLGITSRNQLARALPDSSDIGHAAYNRQTDMNGLGRRSPTHPHARTPPAMTQRPVDR
jgi:DNA-binding CsgD family transcriptional regulator